MFAIVCTQGHMSYYDIKKECDEWYPVLIFRHEGKTILPMFKTKNTAQAFTKRNLPKSWLCGTVELTFTAAEFLQSKNIECIVYDFPRKLKDFVEFDIEIVENEEVEVL